MTKLTLQSWQFAQGAVVEGVGWTVQLERREMERRCEEKAIFSRSTANLAQICPRAQVGVVRAGRTDAFPLRTGSNSNFSRSDQSNLQPVRRAGFR